MLADVDHPLAAVRVQSFDEADYHRFFGQLVPTSQDRDWAMWDNTKPGIDASGAASRTWCPAAEEVWSAGALVFVRLRFDAAAVARFGAPAEAWARWTFAPDGSRADLTTWWPDRLATRLPVATWVSFVPLVAEPERWEIDKLGQWISPIDVVRRGGRSLHAVGEGLHYDGPDGRVTIATPDAPLVAPGRPNLLDADPPVPDLAGGWHVLLHDNCWGTNFPMWNEGPAQFRFTLSVS